MSKKYLIASKNGVPVSSAEGSLKRIKEIVNSRMFYFYGDEVIYEMTPIGKISAREVEIEFKDGYAPKKKAAK